MPSTLVHVALAGLIGCALLGRAFSVRAVVVVMAATAFIDLDVFLGFLILGAHRAAFHTLLLPAVLGVVLYYDVRVRDRSVLAERFGETAPRVSAVSLVAVVLAGIGLDAAANGANLFYPVHDQFYTFDGKLRWTDQQGLIQTFIEEETAAGTTQETQYRTGVDPDPSPGQPEEEPERIFPLVDSGQELLIVLTGAVTVAARSLEARRNA